MAFKLTNSIYAISTISRWICEKYFILPAMTSYKISIIRATVINWTIIHPGSADIQSGHEIKRRSEA